VKVAVLGFGSMGQRHARNAAELGHEVRVFDVNRNHYPWAVGSEDEALDGAEAVVVASPASEHARQMKLAAGSRVLVEKPVALSLQDFATGYGAPELDEYRDVRVGYSLRHTLGCQLLRRRLPEVGPVMTAQFIVACDMRQWPGTTYGDALLEFSHELDLARWLLGPCEVRSAESYMGGRYWFVVLAHESGALSTVRVNAQFRGYERTCRVDGEAGSLHWKWEPHGGLGLSEVWNTVESHLDSRTRDDMADAYRRELQAFLTGSEAGASLADGLAVLQLCDRARELAR
jgi:predicted dehydrogenase